MKCVDCNKRLKNCICEDRVYCEFCGESTKNISELARYWNYKSDMRYIETPAHKKCRGKMANKIIEIRKFYKVRKN